MFHMSSSDDSTDISSFATHVASVWYLVRKPRCTVIIDSVLAGFKTQKDFCSPEGVSTLLPPSGETGNQAMAQDTRRKLDYLQLQTSEIPEGIMKHAVYWTVRNA
jgi:hypothetical protein